MGSSPSIAVQGWNLDGAALTAPPKEAGAGVYHLVARNQQGKVSNPMSFALDTLPDGADKEPNNDQASAQKVTLPVIINGRMDQPGDWDVFQFSGKAGEMIVAEVQARRLDSPLDSLLKITDSSGQVLAINDDREDPGSGLNTHHADSYLMLKLPADGDYFVSIGDTAHNGGEAYGYRLRISPPQPDFALRVVPSSVAMRSKSTGFATVFVLRKDGFKDPIKLNLKNAPEGLTALPVTATGTQESVRLNLKTTLVDTKEPVELYVEGVAQVGDEKLARQAVPAEDRMQAFLWRHLVPAQDFRLLVFNPNSVPPPKRASRVQIPQPKP